MVLCLQAPPLSATPLPSPVPVLPLSHLPMTLWHWSVFRTMPVTLVVVWRDSRIWADLPVSGKAFIFTTRACKQLFFMAHTCHYSCAASTGAQ